jgi:hypothetical protein
MCIAAAPDLISDLTVRDVEGARAETGIDVDQQRQGADIGDAADIGQDVVEIADAQIGKPERAGCDSSSRQIDRLVTGALGKARVVGVDRAHALQRLFRFHRGAEPGSG